MRGLLVGLTLLTLSIGAVAGPIPAASGFDGPARGDRSTLSPGAGHESVLASSRAEVEPVQKPGAWASTPLGRPPLHTLPATSGTPSEAASPVGSRLDPTHPLRGPPSFLA
jgi:hypothetical protein